MSETADNDFAVTFDKVTVTLSGTPILSDVSAKVPTGSCTAIIGPNGAGKTTLLMTLLDQLPYKGNITISSKRNPESPRIGYVPQRLTFDRGMPLTVLEFMAMGKQRRPLWFGVKPGLADHFRNLLASVKAEQLLDRKLGALSGGELQRVLLALALDQDPDLLILDEPAAGVDFHGEYIFCELLEKFRMERGFTQLMVSHDLATVTHHATHVICLNREVAAEGAPRKILTQANLSAIFGLHMGLVDRHAMPNDETSCISSCCSHGDDNHA